MFLVRGNIQKHQGMSDSLKKSTMSPEGSKSSVEFKGGTFFKDTHLHTPEGPVTRKDPERTRKDPEGLGKTRPTKEASLSLETPLDLSSQRSRDQSHGRSHDYHKSY